MTPPGVGAATGRRRFLKIIGSAGALAGLAAALGPLRGPVMQGAAKEQKGGEVDDWPRRRRLLMAEYEDPKRLMEERVGRRRGPLSP